MQKIYLGIVTLLLSSLLNYYTDFVFLLNSDILIFIWLIFYSIMLPIGLMVGVYIKYKSTLNLFKNSLYTFMLYLISVFISGLNFLDFKNFEILGDGATRFIIKIIFTICFVSSLISFCFFQFKNRKYR